MPSAYAYHAPYWLTIVAWARAVRPVVAFRAAVRATAARSARAFATPNRRTYSW